jgi:hypothetical protein
MNDGVKRANHSQRLHRDWAVGIEVVRSVGIDWIDAIARHEPLQIDHVRAV